MLPEHVEELKKLWEEYEQESMPVLDEQELEEMNQRCLAAYKQKQTVQLTIYHDGYKKERKGVITNLDQEQQTIHLHTSDGTEKIAFQKLLHIQPINHE